MKTLVLGLALLGGTAIAQEINTNEPPRKEHSNRNKSSKEGHLEQVQKELNLSGKQMAQLKTLFEKRHKQKEDNKNQLREKANQQKDEMKTELQKILTPEQYKKWEEKIQKRGSEKKSKRKK